MTEKIKKEMKEKTKLRLLIVVCVVLYIVIQVMMIISEKVGFMSYNGVMMAFQFALCLIMVRQDHKVGVITSCILMSFSLLALLRVILLVKLTTPIPGLCNTIIYIVTLILLARQFQIRENEAITDVLTGLSNRRGLYKLLKKRIEDERSFHVIYVDLGNFKFINDNFGHAYGDILMKEVANRMKTVVGKKGIITRIGGDEFVIILNGENAPEEIANKVIEKICEKATIVVAGSKAECYLTAFAGISSYPKDSTNYEDLIKYADIAMYQASNSKTSRIHFFDKDMEKILRRRIEVERLIKEGLENDYFYLVYQPQYEIKNKKLRGFESLLRMKTPDGTAVSPGEFIPVAEKGDLILKIDDYVLRRVLREFKDIVTNESKDLTISINVSAKNIAAVDFADRIEALIKEYDFPAKNLEIEITEYCLVQSVDITIDNIKRLRSIGVQVALDDFGTGYTSLSYLSKMPINLLKIDKSLIDDIENDRKSHDFVKAVISMGHLMGCEVISEGVENENQLALLQEQECDFVQGFVWGKPLDYEVAKELIAGSN